MLGPLLALSSAGLFGLNSAVLRRAVLGGSVLQGLVITVPLALPLGAIAILAMGAAGALAGLSPGAWMWMSLAGISHFIVGRYGNFRATRALGATQSAPVQLLSALVSLALALIFLGEQLTPLSTFGIVLVIAGPLTILRRRAGTGEVRTRAGQKLNYLEGYFWGLVCAAGWGVSPLFIKYGLDGGDMLDSLAGAFVSYLAASLAISLIVLLPGNLAHVRTLNPRAALWFTAAGSLTFIAQMFRYLALAIAPVSIIEPLLQTQVVFRLVFGWLLNRSHEVFGASTLIGLALSFLGVLALTVSIDLVRELVDLPRWMVDLAGTSWP